MVFGDFPTLSSYGVHTAEPWSRQGSWCVRSTPDKLPGGLRGALPPQAPWTGAAWRKLNPEKKSSKNIENFLRKVEKTFSKKHIFSRFFFEKVEISKISTENRKFRIFIFFRPDFWKNPKNKILIFLFDKKNLSKMFSINFFFQNNHFHQAAPIQGASWAPRSDMASLRRKGNPGISQIWGPIRAARS